MLSLPILKFAEMSTKAACLELEIRHKLIDITDCKHKEMLYDLSIELANLVEQKSILLCGIIELTTLFQKEVADKKQADKELDELNEKDFLME